MRKRSGTMQAAGRWAFHLMLAYALLLQVVVGGIAATEHRLSVATGTVCEGHGEPGSDGADGQHSALCCAFGCLGATVPAALDPPGAIALTAPEPRRLAAPLPVSEPANPPVRQVSFAARGPPARA